MLVPAINSVIKMIMALDAVASLVRPPHGAVAYANFAGDLDDAHTGPQTILDALFDGRADPRPSERLASLDGALEAGVHALTDHAAFKLGKGTADLKHQLACRGGG